MKHPKKADIRKVVEFPKERDVLLTVNTEHSTVYFFENLSCFGITLIDLKVQR